MTGWTDFVVGQFIGGGAFFLGMALCCLGCSLKFFFRQSKLQLVARVTMLAGVVFVVLSACPFSLWVYGLFFALLVLAALPAKPGRWPSRKTSATLLLLLVAQSLLMVSTEVLQRTAPKIPFAPRDTLFILGDSISIGAVPPDKNWPELLGDLAKLKVRNLAFGGAKVASSLDSAPLINQDDVLVILELGGNDLLGGTSVPQFREDLEKMLGLVCGPHRRVAMIELPLPPFYNRFGQVQRELAQAHGVTLIPKRYLAKVICTPGATVDGLHFSGAGHALFAHALFELLTPAQ